MMRTLHQVWINENGSLPENAEACREAFLKLHPGWTVQHWSRQQVEYLMGSDFPELCGAYVLCKDWPVAQADLARLCIVRKCGGLYADFDIEWYKNIEPLLTKPAAFFREADVPRVTNSIFYCGGNSWSEFRPLTERIDRSPAIKTTRDVLEFAGPDYLTKYIQDTEYCKIHSHIYFEYPDEETEGRQDFQYGYHKSVKSWIK